MIYAIAIHFDVESTEKINEKIIEIAESNINPYMVNNKIPPHLTISLFETFDEFNREKFLKAIYLNTERESIEIYDIAMFEPKVIYYAPKKSDFLIELNQIATKKLIELGIESDKYYLSDNWVPHIALGVQLTCSEIERAYEIVKKDFEAFTVRIEKIVLAKCNPYSEIACIC